MYTDKRPEGGSLITEMDLKLWSTAALVWRATASIRVVVSSATYLKALWFGQQPIQYICVCLR